MEKTQKINGNQALDQIPVRKRNDIPKPNFGLFDGKEVRNVNPFDGLQFMAQMPNGQDESMDFRKFLSNREAIGDFLKKIGYNGNTRYTFDNLKALPSNVSTEFYYLAPLNIGEKYMDLPMLLKLLMTYPGAIGEVLANQQSQQ